MKFSRCLFLSLLYCLAATAQKTEFNIGLNGTSSFFRGSGASEYAFVYAYNTPDNIIINGAYGTKAGIGWGIDVTAQSSSKSGFLAGISMGYEMLSSPILLLGEYPVSNPNKDSGTKVHMTHGFLNFFPYIGKRFSLKKSLIDINLGMEFGVPLSAKLKVHGKTAPFGPGKPALDVRPRLQAKWQYKNFGVLLSYSIGLFNYYDKRFFSFGSNKYVANVNIGRLGVFYRL